MRNIEKPIMGIYRAPEKHEYLNYSERPGGVLIDTIVLHYTVVNYKDSHSILTADRGVSAHYLVREDGRIDNLVADEKKAWHAGLSNWQGREGVNDFSIGIEIVNPGSGEQGCYATSYEKKLPQEECVINIFPQKQMDSVLSLLDYLRSIYPEIKDQNIIGHSDIAAFSGRKMDPDVAFDWQFLKNNGHGLYSTLTIANPMVLYKTGDTGEEIKELQVKLSSLGYNITINGDFDKNLSNVVRAFNLHHNREVKSEQGFEWDTWDSVADIRLQDLLDQKQNMCSFEGEIIPAQLDTEFEFIV